MASTKERPIRGKEKKMDSKYLGEKEDRTEGRGRGTCDQEACASHSLHTSCNGLQGVLCRYVK